MTDPSIDNVDPHHTGLRMFLSEIAVDALDYLWTVGALEVWPRSVRDIHKAIGNRHEVSRTVINNLMINMTDKGYVNVEERLGQGGMKRLYWPTCINKPRMVKVLTFKLIELVNKSLEDANVEIQLEVKKS